jgi:hypothetical protein
MNENLAASEVLFETNESSRPNVSKPKKHSRAFPGAGLDSASLSEEAGGNAALLAEIVATFLEEKTKLKNSRDERQVTLRPVDGLWSRARDGPDS